MDHHYETHDRLESKEDDYFPQQGSDNFTTGPQRHILVLYSELGLPQRVNYQKAIQLLDARKIPYECIDGSDPSWKTRCVTCLASRNLARPAGWFLIGS
jgi:hypothetical protein